MSEQLLKRKVSDPHVTKEVGVVRTVEKADHQSKSPYDQVVISIANVLYLRELIIAKDKPGPVKEADSKHEMNRFEDKHLRFHHIIGTQIHNLFSPIPAWQSAVTKPPNHTDGAQHIQNPICLQLLLVSNR